MEGRKTEKAAALWLSLILICVAVVHADWHSVGLYAGGPWWGRLSYMFFHANLLHAALNCWCLLSVVFLYEVRWSRLLLAAAIAASVPAAWLGAWFASLLTPTIGLSGMVYALFGLLSFDVRRRWYYQCCMALYLALGFALPNSSAAVHLWCYLLGLLCAAARHLFYRWKRR